MAFPITKIVVPGVNGPFAAGDHVGNKKRHTGEEIVHWDI